MYSASPRFPPDYYDYGHEDVADQTGAASGLGDGTECCALVVDLLCVVMLMAVIGGSAFLLGRVIQIEIVKGGRMKRSFASSVDDVIYPSWLGSG
jgi:hypothetical protein